VSRDTRLTSEQPANDAADLRFRRGPRPTERRLRHRDMHCTVGSDEEREQRGAGRQHAGEWQGTPHGQSTVILFANIMPKLVLTPPSAKVRSFSACALAEPSFGRCN